MEFTFPLVGVMRAQEMCAEKTPVGVLGAGSGGNEWRREDSGKLVD